MNNTAASPILELKNISFAYDAKTVLTDISFSVGRGEYLSVIGPNGSGKTTLLQIMCGHFRPPEGGAYYCGHNVNSMDIRERAKHFAVIYQQQYGSRFPYTCLETVIMGLHPHRGRFEPVRDEALSRIEQVMRLTDTFHFADKLVTEISGGELQRVMLARAIAQRPKILFLDEAMSGLDICARISMTKILRELIKNQGITVVAINHDLSTAYRFSSRVVALCGGRVAAIGAPGQVMTEEFFADVFNVRAEIIKEKGFFIHDNIIKNEREREKE
ncbi:MAG TPA: ABC transporter ATP-binding protein [Clostridia bacterium]|nr:ABC transporter ATP-binding protein [Clostridia bacterium]